MITCDPTAGMLRALSVVRRRVSLRSDQLAALADEIGELRRDGVTFEDFELALVERSAEVLQLELEASVEHGRKTG